MPEPKQPEGRAPWPVSASQALLRSHEQSAVARKGKAFNTVAGHPDPAGSQVACGGPEQRCGLSGAKWTHWWLRVDDVFGLSFGKLPNWFLPASARQRRRWPTRGAPCSHPRARPRQVLVPVTTRESRVSASQTGKATRHGQKSGPQEADQSMSICK